MSIGANDKISRIETCINDIQNFIQMFRDGEFDSSADSENEFWSGIETNAEIIRNEAMRD